MKTNNTFNRTIEELKFDGEIESVELVITFNRTIMELKFKKSKAFCRYIQTSNRTIEELKFSSCVLRTSIVRLSIAP